MSAISHHHLGIYKKNNDTLSFLGLDIYWIFFFFQNTGFLVPARYFTELLGELSVALPSLALNPTKQPSRTSDYEWYVMLPKTLTYHGFLDS